MLASLLGRNASAHVTVPPGPAALELAVGTESACAIVRAGMRCWGQKLYGGMKAPELKHPRGIAAGNGIMCAIDDDGVHCWGAFAARNGVEGMGPPMKNPRQVKPGEFNVCAIDDDGIHCWGNGEKSSGFKGTELNPPPVQHASFVSGMWHGFCAVADGGVQRWGDVFTFGWDKTQVPALKNPRFLNEYCSCAIDDDGAHCWGHEQDRGGRMPALRNPVSMIGYWSSGCALDADGVHCWGDLPGAVPSLQNPKLLAGTLYNEYCAADDKGIHCWYSPIVRRDYDSDPYGLLAIPSSIGVEGRWPTVADPFFDLDHVVDLDAVLARVSSPARSIYYSGILGAIKDKLAYGLPPSRPLSEARYLTAKLLEPAFANEDNTYFRETFLPKYQASLRELEPELGVNDIAHVSVTPLSREIGLRSVESALKVLEPILTGNDRNALAALERTIGQALVNPMNGVTLSTALAAIDGAGPLLAKANAVSKTAFVVPTVRLAADWLKGNL